MQLPEAHSGLLCGRVQACPQLPQLVADPCRSVSQPFAGLPSQSPQPHAQTMLHVPPTQAGVALAREGQAFPQLPQLAALVAVFTQTLPHWVSPLPHDPEQTRVLPITRLSGVDAPQKFPQSPLLDGCSSEVSQPFAGLPSQLPQPALQVRPQLPAVQAAMPLFDGQTVPQLPQFRRSVRVSTSQPLPAIPSQSRNPSWQVTTQAPATQVGTVFASVQALWQAPQFMLLGCRLVSHPSESRPLQLP